MADALISPVVGTAFWALSSAVIGYSAKKIAEESDPIKTPLMGVLGAFVFAAQMINFTIPGTGSSGHLGGGVLMAVLLGPWRAFITLASVLIIQCLFFADGGLLALGCNIFNLAFFPAFIAYPFIYRVIAGNALTQARVAAGSITAAAAGLMMGAVSVVLQTVLSGMTELPFSMFLLFMLPIHLAIGIVEGLVTWAVLSFVLKTEPHLLRGQEVSGKPRFIMFAFAFTAFVIGSFGTWYASPAPDGLEWSIAKVIGKKNLQTTGDEVHDLFFAMQNQTAFLPGYSFRRSDIAVNKTLPASSGTSVSGVIGSLAVLAAAGSAGKMLARKRPQQKSS